MTEKRAEPRLWCSDLIKVRLEGPKPADIIANLENISPSGACVQLEQPVAAGTRICLTLGRRKFPGQVVYCLYEDIGYFAGVRFDAGTRWSRRIYEPKHPLDPAQVVGRKRGVNPG